MTYTQVVAFGDSFVYGDELLDPVLKDRKDAHPVLKENTKYRESNCFAGLLANALNVPCQNFGIPGGSLQSTIWTYLWWLDNDPHADTSIVLVGITEGNRHSFYNPKHIVYPNDPEWNRFIHTSWVHNNPDLASTGWQDLVKQYTILSQCSKLEEMQLKHALLFFENAAQNHHHLTQFFTLRSRAPLTRTYNTLPDLTSLVDLIDMQSGLTMPWGHPNEAGHNVLKNWLLSNINVL